MPAPFHEGEIEVQERLGVRAEMESLGARMFRPAIGPAQAEFLEGLRFILLGALDSHGGAWASILSGPAGFLRVPEPEVLEIAAALAPGDPLADALGPGALLATVGIEFAARRRFRVNGRVESRGDGLIRLRVSQAFGNCPKYIQARDLREATPNNTAGPDGAATQDRVAGSNGVVGPAAAGAAGRFDSLGDRERALVERADTFFISSVSPQGAPEDPSRGLDVSHRGGAPGFVRVEGARTLLFPDYIGNFLFNTLGNLARDPRAGLLFPDFETGAALLLSGTVKILWDSMDRGAEAGAGKGRPGPRVPGAQRMLRFTLREGVVLEGALPFRWSAPEMSPHLPR